jgi:hypothetical protein
MPVLSSLSGHEVNDIAQAALGPRSCPPKAEVTGSNPVGRANIISGLEEEDGDALEGEPANSQQAKRVPIVSRSDVPHRTQ